MERIAHTRTWSYISYRSQWLENSRSIQQRLRAIEEKLSAALHKKLSERFIDHKAQSRGGFASPKNPTREGETVRCDQGLIGTFQHGSFFLSGLCNRFFGVKIGMGLGRKFFTPIAVSWANRAIMEKKFHCCGRDVFFEQHCILTLKKGPLLRQPKFVLKSMELIPPELRKKLSAVVLKWLREQVDGMMISIQKIPQKLRGLSHLINANLGVALCSDLPKEQRFSYRQAQKYGISKSDRWFYRKELLRPKYQELRWALISAWFQLKESAVLPKERVSVSLWIHEDYAWVLGWPVVANRSIRVDVLAKIERLLRSAPKRVAPPRSPMQWLGCTEKEWYAILKGMGYRIHNGLLLAPKKRKK